MSKYSPRMDWHRLLIPIVYHFNLIRLISSLGYNVFVRACVAYQFLSKEGLSEKEIVCIIGGILINNVSSSHGSPR